MKIVATGQDGPPDAADVLLGSVNNKLVESFQGQIFFFRDWWRSVWLVGWQALRGVASPPALLLGLILVPSLSQAPGPSSSFTPCCLQTHPALLQSVSESSPHSAALSPAPSFWKVQRPLTDRAVLTMTQLAFRGGSWHSLASHAPGQRSLGTIFRSKAPSQLPNHSRSSP